MDQRRNYNRYNRPVMQQRMQQPSGNRIIEEIPAYSLAMVYAPRQSFTALYDLNTALNTGTVFKELNLPFAPCGRARHG